MNWTAFLDLFEKALESLTIRKYQKDLEATYNPDDPPGIWIGTANWNRLPPEHVCLNNKGAHIVANRSTLFFSITELIEEWPERLVSTWKPAIGNDAKPAALLSRFTLVVEDASPDSCFGFLIFCARMAGVQLDEIPQSWREHTRAWESGDVVSTGPPESSFGALHSALYHNYAEESWTLAWKQGLQFLAEALKRNEDPSAISHAKPWQQLIKARSLVEFERQTYEDSLSHAETLQLLIPIKGEQKRTVRRRLVDAYLVEEHMPLGLLKSFVRTDSTNPSMKSGFDLMAVHKPYSNEDGDYFSISLTRFKGLHLEDLWKELEQREDQAYLDCGETRDCSNPRSNMVVYRNGLRDNGEPAPSNPWYLDHSRTLVAAPRGTSESRGSKLDWEDVLDAIWTCYQPFGDISVTDASGSKCKLDQCEPLQSDAKHADSSENKLILAQWDNARHLTETGSSDEESTQSFLRFSPSFFRFLAACVDCSDGKKGVSLQDLPQQESFDAVDFSGGFGVVCRAGAYVVDDWRREPLPIEDIKREFKAVSERSQIIKTAADEIKNLYTTVENSLSIGLDNKTSTRLLNKIASMKIQVGKKWAETNVASYDPGVIAFRHALEHRFGIEGKLEEFYASIERISSMLNSYIELKTNSRVAWLSIYGFPIVLCATFFSFIFSRIPHCPPWTESFLGEGVCQAIGNLGIHPIGLFLFLSFSVLGILIFLGWNRIQEKMTSLRQR